MDPGKRDEEAVKRRPTTRQPPASTRQPKDRGDDSLDDVERATPQGERDFDPNVNQRPR